MKSFHDQEPKRSGIDPETPEPESVRQCLTILPDQFDRLGFIPSLVLEGEAGHFPMSGGPGQEPWHFGLSFVEAEAICANYNARAYGLSPQDCDEIVASSMFATLDRRSAGQ